MKVRLFWGVSWAFFEWSVSVLETPFIYGAAGAIFQIMELLELRARSCQQKTLKVCLSKAVILMLQLMCTKKCPKASFLGGFYGIATFGK